MGDIEDERALLTAVPQRARAGRWTERAAAGFVVAVALAIVVVLVVNRGSDGGTVTTDAPPEDLLQAAADHLDRAGSVRFWSEGEFEVTPEAGELSLDELAVRAMVFGDGEVVVGTGSRLGVDFEVTGGPLPPELGPSRIDVVVVDGETWTRLDDEDWDQSEVPDNVVDLPPVDAPDELLDLAVERGAGLQVEETTSVDGMEAHRVSLRLSAEDVGVALSDGGATPDARVDVYVGDRDGRLLQLDISVAGSAPNPVPAQIDLTIRSTYYDHGESLVITPPE